MLYTMSMQIFFHNFHWIFINIFLALLGTVFGLAMIKTKKKFLRFVFFVLWFAFIPNTIYLVTDMNYLFPQLTQVGTLVGILLAVQYIFLALLGVVLFIIGHYSFEKLLLRSKLRRHTRVITTILVIANYLIAFGVALGKMQRTESWDIFINPPRVISDSMQTLSSLPLIVFVLAFGLLTNIVYFSLTIMFKRNLLKSIYK